MPYSTVLHAILASLVVEQLRAQIRELLRGDQETIMDVIVEFLAAPMTPAAVAHFEERLGERLRELGRGLLAAVLNHMEPAAEQLPASVRWDGDDYRRLNQATANRHVATCFGTITLWRHGYRPHDRDSAEATIFPLEQALGLVESATPALAKRVGRYLAEAGATQERVLQHLAGEHDVRMGVKRLRSLASSLSEAMTPHRHDGQVERLLEWLTQAQASKGSHKPVLSVGRDGITLGTQPWGLYEVASVATVTVYDRADRRLGTVQLARVPEFGQSTLSGELTRLVEGVLRRWEGPLPRLCYVTDAGDNEVSYFRRVLRRLRHPRTGKKLSWQWIVDYYHAAERIRAVLGAEDAEAAREAERRAPGAAVGSGVAHHAWAEDQAAAGVRPGVQLPPRPEPVHGLSRVSSPGLADRQWRDGSGVQDSVHATAEAVGHALERDRSASDPEPARDPLERHLGRGLRPCLSCPTSSANANALGLRVQPGPTRRIIRALPFLGVAA
jgi:hypothetical protein